MRDTQSFIEVQFPVSKLSKESYKERKAGDSQTLASLGKWHGRKPLVLVRALILGLLMPASDDPKKDRDVFLKLMTMDDEGMWRRCKGLSARETEAHLTPSEKQEAIAYLTGDRVAWAPGLAPDRRSRYAKRAFLRMGYDERLTHCVRPEEIDGPDAAAWREINAHLGTTAASLPELVRELGTRRFGHIPRVGDAFAGGGSIPFEAARLGCDAFASDLNPTAALHCYGALKVIGGPTGTLATAQSAQRAVYEEVRRQVRAWGIERNDVGWEADVYLYCAEVKDPPTGWRVPLLPSRAIDPDRGVVAELVPDKGTRSFEIRVRSGASREAVAVAKADKTADDGVVCPVDAEGNPVEPRQRRRTSSKVLRGPDGLRLWEAGEFEPRPDDVFQERLYCIRWVIPDPEVLLATEQIIRSGRSPEFGEWAADTIGPALDAVVALMADDDAVLVRAARAQDWAPQAVDLLQALATDASALPGMEEDGGAVRLASGELAKLRRSFPQPVQDALAAARRLPRRHYAAPTDADRARERRCRDLLAERFDDWQRRGCIPSRRMEPGKAIKDPIRNRGWSHWHQMYTPRQLLVNGLFARACAGIPQEPHTRAACMLGLMRVVDFNAKLSRWHSGGAKCEQTLYAVIRPSPLANHASRATSQLRSMVVSGGAPVPAAGVAALALGDAAHLSADRDAWITDPGYGDMAPYAEYSEFYLAWLDGLLPTAFPSWYTDSKRALAVELADEQFAQILHGCYANLSEHTADGGLHVVMFTSWDTQVWAELVLLLWAAGLHVTQAWIVGTETEAGAKEGGSATVQATACLVLRKGAPGGRGDLSEIRPEVQMEVRSQLQRMLDLDDRESPNFSDSDYQIAAYAAALRVITSYESIRELDVKRELARSGRPDPQGIVRGVIEQALREATDFLVPDGMERAVWRGCSAEERLYLKGLEVESHGEKRRGVYQEFAKGFGVAEYRDLLQSDAANETRLRTPSEMKGRDLETGPLGGGTLRRVLYAVFVTCDGGMQPEPAVAWLRSKYPGMSFFDQRQAMVNILRFLASRPGASMPHWKHDSEAAHLLAARLENEN